MLDKKIPVNEFLKFKMDYVHNNPLQYKGLRFGQAFLKKFFDENNVEDTQLYYTPNKSVAETIIWQYYIQK